MVIERTHHLVEMINWSKPVPCDTTDQANECKIEIVLEVIHSFRWGFLDDSSVAWAFPQMLPFGRMSNSFNYSSRGPQEIQIAANICREDMERYGFDHDVALHLAEDFKLKCHKCVECHYESMETNEQLTIRLFLWVVTVYDYNEFRYRSAILESSNEWQFPICPASEEAIAALVKFRSVLVTQDEYVCTVCTEEFEKGDEVVQLQCTHSFHSDCIVPWLKNMNTCPNCRTKI